MADNFVKRERVKTPLDERKLTLRAPTPGHAGKFASLMWGFVGNNPRITVYTNDPDDSGESKGYGRIVAALDLVVFCVFLKELKNAIDAPGEYKRQVDNMNYTFFGGKRSDEPKLVSQLWVGKDKDGMVYISVTAKDRPKIKFAFHFPDFHKLRKEDGNEITKAEASVAVAESYYFILGQMMTHMAVSHWQEPPPKPQNGNGNNYRNGGQQNSRPAGNSYTNADNTEMEDMPF